MDTESRKRSCDELAEDGDELGLGGTTVQDQQNECGEHNSEMTKRSRKKQRKNKATKARSQTDSNGTGTSTNKPGLQFASHRLNSSVKLTDLRDLVLYCLADGVAPSWISVQNRNQFQKAVIVLVPGLEKSMFDGSQSLSLKQTFSEQIEPDAQAQDNSVETDLEVKQWTLVTRTSTTSRNDPDSYLPISLEEDKLQEPLKPLVKIFKDVWPIKATGDDRYSKVHSPLHSMLQRSIQETSEDKNKRKNMKGAKPVKVRDDFSAKKTPITEYIASLEELRDNSYVIHPASISDDMDKEQELEQREKKSTHSSSSWKDAIIDTVSDSSSPKLNDSNSSSSNDIFSGRTIYAVDCEMCVVGEDEYALTRISVLSWKGSIIMDELVKPEKPITNYLTQFSGISEEMLVNVKTSLEDIQERLLKLFTANTILVGHSLDSDLKALKFTHPYIVDTSIIYPHPRGPPMKSSLKWLCQKYLNREIQKGHGSKGHNSVEDAQACLDLVRLKCDKGKQWGTPDAVHESIFKALSKKPKTGQHSGISEGRQGAIVDLGSPEKNFGQQATYSIGCKDDDGVVDAIKRCVLGDLDGEYIPGGGVELTWARLRELDYLQGWANNNSNNQNNQTITTTIDKMDSTSPTPPAETLSTTLARTTNRIQAIHKTLPPNTLLIIYSGTGDPRDLARLQEQERQFKREYAVKKWDEISVQWTDVEAQALRRACDVARAGVGFICVT